MLSTKNKKRVLHIITGLEVGGAETNLFKVLPKLERDFENRVCCLMKEGPMGEKLRQSGIPVTSLNVSSVFDFFRPSILRHFRHLLIEFRPNIIETYLIHAELFGRVWGRVFGVKKIICSHRGGPLLQWRWLSLVDRFTSGLVTLYIFLTPAEQQEQIQTLRINPKKTTVIPNVIDTSAFNFTIDRTKKKLALGINPENINIVIVANLRKEKGHSYLIKAFDSLYAQGHTNINLLIVGDGEQRPILEHLRDTANSKHQIYFLGKRSDVFEILKIADIFVLPTFCEGMSNAILEAMASSLPIVTTDIPVNKDLLKDGFSGILVPPGDSISIKQALQKLLKNPEERDRIGTNAQLEIQKHYQVDIIVEKIRQMIHSL